MNLLVDGLEEKTVFKTELTKQLSIDNHTEVYPVYKIRLDKLYYNDQNDRIATWISQYKADNKINSIDMKNKEEYNNRNLLDKRFVKNPVKSILLEVVRSG